MTAVVRRGGVLVVVPLAAVSLLAVCDLGTGRYGDVYEPCDPGDVRCIGSQAETCNSEGTGWGDAETCEGHTPLCVPGLGCAACVPGDRRCQGANVLECDAEGITWGRVETCSEEEFCYEGRCGGDCARAGVFRSYEGCEYMAVTLMNSQLASDFSPAVVVSNRNDDPVSVSVTQRGVEVATATVAPRSTETIELPWVHELKGGSHPTSVNVPHAAYRIVTDLPATLYQFNPLEYALPRDCADGDDSPLDGVCYSYSNDASLLLPVPVLTEHYIVLSRPNLGIRLSAEGTDQTEDLFSPSVLAVVNPQDHAVTVDILFSAETVGGTAGRSYLPGETGTFTIEAEGVLQIAAASPRSCIPDWTEPETFACGVDLECRFGYCDLSDRDLTGTEVVASEPVAVFGAHDCDFIPWNRWACDHLEEQLFPYETWGRRFVATQSHREAGEPDLFRVLSGSDGNEVRFEPASVHAPVTLNRGDHVELEAWGAFEITATGPVMVGQFLVGQSYNGFTIEELPPGDPSFSLVPPLEQYRTSYNFLAPDTFDRSFVNITVAEEGLAVMTLDSESLAEETWEAVGETEYRTLRREIGPGSHVIASDGEVPFGITVYGYGQYTSYMYPGGLDLEPIAVW